MKTYLLLALVLLTGCNPRQIEAGRINNSYVQYEATPSAYAFEFQLADGTRCVAYRESITCQWAVVVINPKVQ